MSEFGTDEKNRMSSRVENAINKTSDENCEVITTCTMSTIPAQEIMQMPTCFYFYREKNVYFLHTFISNMLIKWEKHRSIIQRCKTSVLEPKETQENVAEQWNIPFGWLHDKGNDQK